MSKKRLCEFCGKEIPTNSSFCPCCGGKQAGIVNTREKTRTPFIVSTIILSVLCFALIAGAVAYYFIMTETFQDIQNEFKLKLQNKESRIEAVEKELNRTSNKVSELNSRIDTLQTENQDLILQNVTLKELNEYLQEASTTNGMISFNSRVYAVKKGAIETIKVNWHVFETNVFMRSTDTSVAEAEWKGENLRVTGNNEGVTEIIFGSDSNITQNNFSIVIICY